MSVNQAVFNTIFNICSKFDDKVKVYEFMPRTPELPNMMPGITQVAPQRNKQAIFAQVMQTIEFRADQYSRAALTSLMYEVEQELWNITEVEGIQAAVRNVTSEVRQQMDPNQNIYLGILDIEIAIY